MERHLSIVHVYHCLSLQQRPLNIGRVLVQCRVSEW